MKIINKIAIGGLLVLLISVFSCRNLDDLNVNPNGSDPTQANPQFLITNVLTSTGNLYVDLSYWDYFAGVMQQIQKLNFSGNSNKYEWQNQSWSDYYGILRTNDLAYKRAVEEEDDFIQAISLTMKSYVFALITNLWGDAPYTDAMKGNEGGQENEQPKYDDQETIFKGIVDDLKEASSLFANHSGVNAKWDVYYNGDGEKWEKFANSLMLRYYLRVAEKSEMQSWAKEGIEAIASSGKYISDASEDANLVYEGTSSADSWPHNVQNSDPDSTDYKRIRMGSVFLDTLRTLNDPRISVFAERVQIPIKIDDNHFPNDNDKVDPVDGIRYVHQSAVDAFQAGSSETDGIDTVDTNPDYVGIPPAIDNDPETYNFFPQGNQSSYNPHVSRMNVAYMEASGELLKVRMMTAAEVHFILAEAKAVYGWTNVNAEDEYNAGIKASFDAYNISDDYASYISQPNVAYNGTQSQIMTQKWISSWTYQIQSWFDYRRTGYPDLKAGPYATKTRLPIRFIYNDDELDHNAKNVQAALDNNEETNYSNPLGKNSPWAKMWLLQNTGKPW